MADKLNARGQNLARFLEEYDASRYERPSVTVDMAVFTTDGRLLLIKRADHPNIGSWALPGGFMNMDETPYQAACRELMEETGVNTELEHLGAYAEPSRDPRTRIVTLAFYTLARAEELAVQAGDDAADARLFRYSLETNGDVEIPEKTGEYPDMRYPVTAFGAPLPSKGEGWTLTLENGRDTLSARLAVCGKTGVLLRGTAKPEHGTIAGDHPLIIFDAIRRLKA